MESRKARELAEAYVMEAPDADVNLLEKHKISEVAAIELLEDFTLYADAVQEMQRDENSDIGFIPDEEDPLPHIRRDVPNGKASGPHYIKYVEELQSWAYSEKPFTLDAAIEASGIQEAGLAK